MTVATNLQAGRLPSSLNSDVSIRRQSVLLPGVGNLTYLYSGVGLDDPAEILFQHGVIQGGQVGLNDGVSLQLLAELRQRLPKQAHFLALSSYAWEKHPVMPRSCIQLPGDACESVYMRAGRAQ